MLPVFIGNGVNLLVTPLIVSNLGLTNFGLWSLTGTIAQYGILFDLGVSRAIMRYVAYYNAQGDREKERAVTGGTLMIVVLLGCFLMIFPLLFSEQLGRLIKAPNSEIAETLFVTSILVLISGLLGNMFSNAAIGRGRMLAGNVGVAFQRASVAIGGVIAIYVDRTLSAFAIGSAIGGIVGLVVVLAAVFVDERDLSIGRPQVGITADLLRFGVKSQAMSVAEIVLFQSGKLFAGLIIGPAAAGAFELGSRLAMGVRSIGTAASAAISAYMTRLYVSDGLDGIRSEYARLIQRNAAVSNFAPFGLAATAFALVPMWLGAQNTQVMWIAIALTLAFTANISSGVTTAVAFALNQLGLLMVVVVVSSTFSILIQLVLAHMAGLNGILVGMTLAITISSILGIVSVHRRNKIPLMDYFGPVSGPFIVGGISTILGASVAIFSSPTDRMSAIVPLACSAVIFCTVYILLSWLLGYLPSFGKTSRSSH